MLIDWFTVAAQVLNFLILVWLLKRYLYKPVLDAIDAREMRIKSELADAAGKQAEAQTERESLRTKNAAFDAERAGLMAAAAEQGTAERSRLMGEARQEAGGLRAQYAQALRADEARLGGQISRLAQEQVFAAARQALTDLCDTRVEDRIADAFLHRLRAMDAGNKALLATAFGSAADAALVRSSIELSAEQRTAIQKTLNTVFAADIPLRFDTNPDVICGIELSVGGQKLSWSVAEYLDALERKVGELVDGEAVTSPVVNAAAAAKPAANASNVPPDVANAPGRTIPAAVAASQ
jgi:F-type H+-transporting ATPase subunit b